MIYLQLILKILGLWFIIYFSLVAGWCSLRWFADRRARVHPAPFQREWPIAISSVAEPDQRWVEELAYAMADSGRW